MILDADVFKWLGVRYKKSGDGWYICCPFPNHKGGNEKTPSLGINEKNGMMIFHCFGCEASGTFPHLVASVKGVTVPEAISLLEKKFAIDDYRSDEQLTKLEKVVVNIPSWGERYAKKGLLGEAVLELYEEPDPTKYLKRRGFTDLALKRFEIGYDRWKERVTIPIRDGNNDLVGIVGRAVNDAQPKYLFYGDDFRKGDYVYGMGDVEGPELVVCEGHLDRVHLWQNGIRNAVALQGAMCTDTQAEWIARTADEVIIWLDNDEAGETGTEKLINALRGLGTRNIYRIDWSGFPDAHDPTDFNLSGCSGMVESKQFASLKTFLTRT